MSLSRQLKRKQQLPFKPNTQFFSSEDREIAKKLEEGFIAAGELKGIATAEEIFRERFIENVPQIKGVGKHFRQEFAKAMGLIFTDEEIKRMEQKK
ncbi:hypothetical protein [Priestia megaterium]|uniref:hypothetical protein n=1 Tax=Priestia megaterium TaxID=1404 RepID=UPI002E1CA881|nr:hypothetical protein [Priestia megaterium]